MLKKHEIIFSTIKVPLDFIIIIGSFFIAREIRLISDLIPSVSLPIQTINTHSLIYYAIIGSLLYILLFSIHGLYNSKITISKIKEFFDIIHYGIYWFLFFSVGIFFLKGVIINEIEDIPRLIILFTLILSSFGMILERIFLNNIQYFLIRNGKILKKNILIITNDCEKNINSILQDITDTQIYRIAGYMNKTIGKHQNSNPIFYISHIKELKEEIKKNKIDEILQINSDYSKDILYKIWNISRIFGIRYRYIPQLYDISSSNTSLSLINKIPVIEIENTNLGIWGRVIKRAFDIGLSFISLIILMPFGVIVSILIFLNEPFSPIFFKNKRVGQNGKIFNLYKFRYLKWEHCIKESYSGNHNGNTALQYEEHLIKTQSIRKGPLYKIKNDPRKTKIGHFLEKYSIDELPQLFNVLLGNMSLTGPRPHQPREVQKYNLGARRILTIKPGITGMAQVNGREKNDFEKEILMDIFYIENWSFLLDLKILFKTIGIIFQKK